jgi:methionine synthase I (cobalamin-dependent)
MNIHSLINECVCVFDGAMGTYYLMTPFSRTELMSRIIRTISEY